jgi:hypothetical protein
MVLLLLLGACPVLVGTVERHAHHPL